jgi:hypothetical protein
MFRKPKYPIIANIDGFLICGKSEAEFYKHFKKCTLGENAEEYDVFASDTAEWTLMVKDMIITPALTIGQRWTKLKFIELFNNSPNSRLLSVQYSTKSLSSKTVDRVFNDIYELIESSLN